MKENKQNRKKVSEMTRGEKLSLIAFKNVMEKKKLEELQKQNWFHKATTETKKQTYQEKMMALTPRQRAIAMLIVRRNKELRAKSNQNKNKDNSTTQK